MVSGVLAIRFSKTECALRDEDFAKFKLRGDEIDTMKRQYTQMELRLKGMVDSSEELQTTIRYGVPPCLFRKTNYGCRQQHTQNRHLEIELDRTRAREQKNKNQQFAENLDKFAKERHELQTSLK